MRLRIGLAAMALAMTAWACGDPFGIEEGSDAVADATGEAGPDAAWWDLGGQDAQADTGGGGGYYPPTATPQQVAALKQLNLFRDAVGLPPADEDERLNSAAQAHAEFIVNHCKDYQSSKLSPHYENDEWEGFTGEAPWDRTAHFGYSSYGIGEVIAFVNNPAAAVTGWMDTLYHRIPLIDPSTVEVGYGGAMKGSCPGLYGKIDVMDIGMSSASSDAIVLYPPPDAKPVRVSFDGMESPQPPPPPGGYPSGYIVTVQFGDKVGFKVTGHRLLQDGAVEVAHTFLAPYADAANGIKRDSMADTWVALYAHEPLKKSTPYTVVIDFERGGKPLHLEWSFTTGTM
jgi:hypothetical protein